MFRWPMLTPPGAGRWRSVRAASAANGAGLDYVHRYTVQRLGYAVLRPEVRTAQLLGHGADDAGRGDGLARGLLESHAGGDYVGAVLKLRASAGQHPSRGLDGIGHG